MSDLIPPEILVETSIFNYLKEKFAGEKFPGKTGEKLLFFAQGFIPKLNYKDKVTINGAVDLSTRLNSGEVKEENELVKSIPLLLVRTGNNEQILKDGYEDGTTEIEVVLGVYDDSPTGYQSAHSLAYKVKKELLENPHVKAKFSIKVDQGMKGKLLEEESGGDYWFYSLKFKTFMPVIKPRPLF